MWREEALAAMHGPIKEFEAAWRDCAEGAAIPTAPRMDAVMVRRLLPHLMALEVVTDDGVAARFRARLIGAHHQKLTGGCRAGEVLDDVAPHVARALRAAETGQPVYACADDAAECNLAVFPFASDGRTVDRFIAVTAAA